MSWRKLTNSPVTSHRWLVTRLPVIGGKSSCTEHVVVVPLPRRRRPQLHVSYQLSLTSKSLVCPWGVLVWLSRWQNKYRCGASSWWWCLPSLNPRWVLFLSAAARLIKQQSGGRDITISRSAHGISGSSTGSCLCLSVDQTTTGNPFHAASRVARGEAR